MADYTLISQEINIVALGSFTPAIFQPEWLVKHELIAPNDIVPENLELKVIHNDLTQFSTPWFTIEVTNKRLMLKTLDPSRSEGIRDLIVSIFGILSETPIASIGLNLVNRYRCNTEQSWHKAGYSVVPKRFWDNALGNQTHVGLINVEVKAERNDEIDGYYRYYVGPSNAPPNPEFEIKINDHIDITSTLKRKENVSLSEFILNYWETSYINSERVIKGMIKEMENGK
jgi:hypothetical protein